MRVLVVDIGGTNLKILATGETTPRRTPSGRKMTPQKMVADVKALAAEWKYDAVALGYPGAVHHGRIVAEPKNLAKGWVAFDFTAAFGCTVRIINDAAMQALGGYQGGLMLFLGLGTGLGSALIADGVVIPLELAHLPFKGGTYEHYLGVAAFKRLGRKRWQKHVEFSVAHFIEALRPDDVVLGGGNTKNLKKLPPGCREGGNAHAFLGGFRLCKNAAAPSSDGRRSRGAAKAKRRRTVKPPRNVQPLREAAGSNA